jgi:hypothetical protein
VISRIGHQFGRSWGDRSMGWPSRLSLYPRPPAGGTHRSMAAKDDGVPASSTVVRVLSSAESCRQTGWSIVPIPPIPARKFELLS